ncbi:hypothetical protein PWG15_23730 (plasmid) [Ensifer adhaerens]|uniref:hypothetical protein n=1 Tax=Ensifer adhaerens TaxID=106592 RepID=UPI0023AA12B7|nr:hypothetical protein [Ensifer adhaerens]WDZ80774.1 hypothetical protein PWG15_23730 [Ensifer adhaerens]
MTRFLSAALLWLAAVLPAAAQSVVLDTDEIHVPYLADALKQAYQLPLLADLEATPSEREEALSTEKARLQGVIAGFGYLDGDMTEEKQGTRIVLRPTLGHLYRVTSVELKGIRPSELGREVVDRLASIINDFVGQPATTFVAESFTRRILQTVSAEDFAHARRRATDWVRKGEGIVTAVIDIDLGPRTRFGAVQFSGALRMESELQDLVPFRSGERYSAALVEQLRRNIEALETVKSVNVAVGKDEEGLLPIDVRIREAPANLETLRHTNPLDVGSGLVAMAGLLLVQVGMQAGTPRSRLRPIIWITSVCVVIFAILATLRLVSFLA